MNENRNRAITGILLLVFLFFIILMVFAYFTVKALKTGESFNYDGQNGTIAVVEVKGIILDSKETIRRLGKAAKASDIKAIVVRIDSPGGAIAPVQEIYHEILRIDLEKPVYSSLASVAASGGYYIASATRRIYSNAGTMVGSIGVIMPRVDMTELFKWAKLKPEPLTAGRFKDLAASYRPMSDEEREILQSMLKDDHEQFIKDILLKRKEKIKGPVENVAEGQIFTGNQAMKLGLVDEIAGLWQAGRSIHEELKLSGEFGFKYIKRKKEFRFMKLLENIDEVSSKMEFLTKWGNAPMFLMKW